MKPRSPTLEGFRAMFRRPSFGLAEIAWRWSFGFAGSLLLVFSFLEYLDTLPVSAGDLFLLRSRHPYLISQALAHILRGSAPRVVAAALVLGLTLAVAWVGIAALGRAATVKALLSYFAEGDSSGQVRLGGGRGHQGRGRLRSLVGLNFFRVGATLAAVVGCLGALLVAGFASPKSDPSPGSVVLIFLMLIMLVWLAWSVLNWVLSLAAIFVVAEGRDTLGAVAATMGLCRHRSGSVFAAGTWFGLAHLGIFIVASTVVAFPLAFAGVLPAGVVLGGVLMVTLLYFVVVDFLYVGRLAAYVAILGLPEAPVTSPTVQSLPPDSTQQLAPSIQSGASGVDPGDLILSDTENAPSRLR
jgi:hypothetical protein